MKFLLASLSIALATSSLSAAPAEPATTEAAEELAPIPTESLVLARQFVALAQPATERMDTLRGFVSMVAYEGSDDPQDAAAEQRADKIMARVEPTIEKLMPALMDAYAYAYAREFSADELRQLIAFAQTPAGKHFVTSAAKVEGDDGVLTVHQSIGEAIEPIMRDVAKEVCSKRAAERLAAGDTKAKCPLSEPETAAS